VGAKVIKKRNITKNFGKDLLPFPKYAVVMCVD